MVTTNRTEFKVSYSRRKLNEVSKHNGSISTITIMTFYIAELRRKTKYDCQISMYLQLCLDIVFVQTQLYQTSVKESLKFPSSEILRCWIDVPSLQIKNVYLYLEEKQQQNKKQIHLLSWKRLHNTQSGFTNPLYICMQPPENMIKTEINYERINYKTNHKALPKMLKSCS